MGQLVRPLVKAVSWRPLVAVGLAGMVMVGLTDDPGATFLRARVAGIALGGAGAYVLDDPAAVTLASSPTPLAARWGLRAAGALLLAMLAWGAIVLAASGDVPIRAMTLEVLTYLVVGFAAGAVGARLASELLGGAIGSVFVALVASSCLVARVTWWPVPMSPLDPHATRQLVTLAAVAMGLLALASRDPARRTLP